MLEDIDKQSSKVYVTSREVSIIRNETSLQIYITTRRRWHLPKVYFAGFWRHSREISVAIGGENLIEITFGKWTTWGKVYGVGLMLRGHMMEFEFRYKNYNKNKETTVEKLCRMAN